MAAGAHVDQLHHQPLDIWFPRAVTQIEVIVRRAFLGQDRDHVLLVRSESNPEVSAVKRGSGWWHSEHLQSNFCYLPAGDAGAVLRLPLANLTAPRISLQLVPVGWDVRAGNNPLDFVWVKGTTLQNIEVMSARGVGR